MTRGEFQRREIANNQSNLAYILVRFQELKPKQNPEQGLKAIVYMCFLFLNQFAFFSLYFLAYIKV